MIYHSKLLLSPGCLASELSVHAPDIDVVAVRDGAVKLDSCISKPAVSARCAPIYLEACARHVGFQ